LTGTGSINFDKPIYPEAENKTLFTLCICLFSSLFLLTFNFIIHPEQGKQAGYPDDAPDIPFYNQPLY
jgi:hypothetical protein